jgi:predicted amidophosphoribosyltransferase
MQEHAEGPMSLPSRACPECGAKNEARASACKSCGAELTGREAERVNGERPQR